VSPAVASCQGSPVDIAKAGCRVLVHVAAKCGVVVGGGVDLAVSINRFGPGKVAYQMTLASSHDITAKGLQDAVVAVGATKQDPLRCQVVPEVVLRTLVNKMASPSTSRAKRTGSTRSRRTVREAAI
jgi:O-acetyl-ADP-ribose deacetylase (regulator of RNase III)